MVPWGSEICRRPKGHRARAREASNNQENAERSGGRLDGQEDLNLSEKNSYMDASSLSSVGKFKKHSALLVNARNLAQKNRREVDIPLAGLFSRLVGAVGRPSVGLKGWVWELSSIPGIIRSLFD